MDLSTFIVTVFCLIDDWLADRPLRQHGPQPTLQDSEVLTMEVVGEFLGYDEDQAIYGYFQQHWGEWFPALRRIHRTTLMRQATNLWRVKAVVRQWLLRQVDFDEQVSIVNSFPVPVCRFARASRCRSFRDQAAYGYDELAKQTFCGFRAHLRVCWPGVIVSPELMSADVHDLQALDDLTDAAQGWVLGDRNSWSPKKQAELSEQGVTLLAPYKSAKRERNPWPRWLVQVRRRIDTVFGPLVSRFQAKVVWARDMWHLCFRWLHRILNHTVAFFLVQQTGLESPLQFVELILLETYTSGCLSKGAKSSVRQIPYQPDVILPF